MSDRNRASGISLAEALRALPQTAPEHSVWPQLAAQLAAQANRQSRTMPRGLWKYAVPAALAAGLVLAFATMRAPHKADSANVAATVAATVAPAPASSITTNAIAANKQNATNVQTPATTIDAGVQLAALQKHSQALEHWLRETRAAAAPMPGQDLAAVAEIEDMIGLVDVQLAAPARATDLPLWQHRVALLEDLTVLRYSNYSIAEIDTRTTTTNRATWIN